MPVEIVPYTNEWPRRFQQLADGLRAALGETALRIDHIGSTSVPGLAAKPIVDLQISVADFEPLDAYRVPLEGLGYVFRADNPELTKRYFREGPGQPRTHIHVRQRGSWAEQFALLFRDYLRSHGDEADRYAEVKRSLALKCVTDRAAYTDAKEPYLWDLMRRADRWSQDVGWRLGPSDA
ncbi:MAG: GrpB family protein [Gemmatimonadaceae bacterium]